MRNSFVAVVCLTLLVVVTLRGLSRGPGRMPTRGGPAPFGEQLNAQARTLALLRAGRGVVADAVADLYKRPDAASSLADQALLGDTVKVLGQGGTGFVQVETQAAYRGWVPVTALLPLPPGAPAYGEGQALFVSARFANVYGQPDVEPRNPLVVAPLGARLRLVKERDARWLQVALPDGRQAFVQRGDVTSDKGMFTAACVTGHALRHEGTPYLWGGRSTYGVDCSGLVLNAYAACGVVPPRDADLQHDWPEVRPVEAAALLPGDLVFFGLGHRGAGTVPKVTHVGLYLGEDRFIHATTWERPTVHTSTFSDPHWQGLLLGLRHHPGLQGR